MFHALLKRIYILQLLVGMFHIYVCMCTLRLFGQMANSSMLISVWMISPLINGVLKLLNIMLLSKVLYYIKGLYISPCSMFYVFLHHSLSFFKGMIYLEHFKMHSHLMYEMLLMKLNIYICLICVLIVF